MALSFGASVSVNNLLALRAASTYLFNYGLHEKPTFIERQFIIPWLQKWVEKKAILVLHDLRQDQSVLSASVSLNDVSGDFFAVLYTCQHPGEIGDIKTGRELFLVLAHMALEFEKIKKPRDPVSHG